MALDEKASHYDVLEVTPDASPQEIREAYLRLKSAYSKDSLAVYTLMSQDDTDEMRHQIEEAYLILSNIEKRKDYDKNHGLLSLEEEVTPPVRREKIVSIDRVPPMDSEASEEDLLVAPSTDFTQEARDEEIISFRRDPNKRTPPPKTEEPRKKGPPQLEDTLKAQVDSEKEWKGSLLKQVREAYEVSLEEMSEFTKISKNYIRAIEAEDYSKLPAAVYLRGFVIQISKKLKLPSDKVAAAYVKRFKESCPDKD